MTAHTLTHTLTYSYIRYPSVPPPSLSVILKPATKASGLISSSPHHACKDLDPTQGSRDNIPFAWPPPILSPLSLSLSLPPSLSLSLSLISAQGPWRAQTEALDRSQIHYTHSEFPSFRLHFSVCVWWAVTRKANGSSAEWSGHVRAATCVQLWAPDRETGRQTGRQTGLSPLHTVIIQWLMRAQIMVTVWASTWVFQAQCLTGANSLWFGHSQLCQVFECTNQSWAAWEWESVCFWCQEEYIYTCIIVYYTERKHKMWNQVFRQLFTHFWSVLANKCPTSAGWVSVEYIVIQSLERLYW